ncbi:MAG TPA: FtsX-like permease family protein, partial [Polyangiaceae bacterium]|nr:FtsX-like permease family protein [Polyangiaceae bacterium]
LGRNKLRTLLTIAGVSVAIVTFILLRTVLSAWTAGADHAAKDRVGTRHKVSFIMPLPKRYLEEIKQIPGVKGAAGANWFGAKDPKHETEFFGSFAVDPKEYLEVYDEILIPPEQREAWFQNRTGAVVGDALAKKMGWRVGDRVTLTGTIYPGDWEFQISGIYTAVRKSVDRSSFMFHYDYLNDSQAVANANAKDLVGWIVSRIDDPGKAAEIARTIDARFDERDQQTLSMSERAMNTSFIGMISAILKAVDVVSLVILAIMVLILGNTVAMGVRERTHEYGVLRAIGFLPKHLAVFVLSEAVVVSVAGGVVGVMISYPFVQEGLGRFLEENMGAFFPFFRIDPATIVWALVLAALLGAVAAALPAYTASRLKVIEALRRTG